MENQAYLDQIAESSKPITPNQSDSTLSKILHSKIFLIVLIGLTALVLILVIGSALTGNKKDLQSEVTALKLHVDNTSSVIGDYQSLVKSSTLRSYSASLKSILSATSSELGKYLSAKYKKQSENKNLATEAATQKDALLNELFEAKITGNLDRIYAHKMTYEVSRFMSKESAIYNTTKDESLQTILSQSYNSLEILYDSFNNFSETTN